MRLFTAGQMRAVDAAAVASGTASDVLMARAGRAVADAVTHHFAEAQRIAVLCGPGNNGGDGYVAARELHDAGRAPRVLELRPEPKDEAARSARARWTEVGRCEALSEAAARSALAEADLVVDALLGSGLGRPLDGTLAAVVAALGASPVPVVSVDVPTGVNADAADLPGPHVRAAMTVQLGGAKRASAFAPARDTFGTTVVDDLGLPRERLEDPSLPRLVGPDEALAAWPARPGHVHKYRAGTVLVVAGSARYRGAAELSCRAAHRAGAGLVTLASDGVAPDAWPETVFEPISWRDAGSGSDRADPVRRLADLPRPRRGAWLIGPGLEHLAASTIGRLLGVADGPVVLDAGALQPDARTAVRHHGASWLTPHHGEAARLLGWDAATVSRDPIEAATALAADWSTGVVLKGPGTVVAAPGEAPAVVSRGGPELASGGTGDALAGILAAVLAGPAGKASSFAAVAGATWLHGRAGEMAAARHDVGLRASDLIACLGPALREARGA